MGYKLLSEVSVYRKDRISSDKVNKENYISTENMLPNRGGVESATTVASAKTFPAYKKGDILLSNIRPYFKKIWYADKEGGCSNDVLVVKAGKSVDSKFLYYVLSDNNFFNYSTVTSKGTKMPRGSKNAIMKYWVPDLDLPTQKKIADILSSYDELIKANNERIELLEQAAQELYKEWFVRFRFPGYENAKFEDGIPEGWECCRLGKILSFGAGKTRPKSGETYPVYGSNGILDYCNNYNSENAIIIGRVGVYCGTVYYEPDKCWISDNALFAESKNSMHFYNYYLLKNMNLNARQIGTGQPLITQGLLNKIRILLPSESLMMKYNQIASELLKQQDLLRKMNVNIAAQRDMLLPRLMSGKLEV